MSQPPGSDPELLAAFRAQLTAAVAARDPAAFLGLWEAWKNQPGTDRGDLLDIIKDATADLPG